MVFRLCLGSHIPWNVMFFSGTHNKYIIEPRCCCQFLQQPCCSSIFNLWCTVWSLKNRDINVWNQIFCNLHPILCSICEINSHLFHLRNFLKIFPLWWAAQAQLPLPGIFFFLNQRSLYVRVDSNQRWYNYLYHKEVQWGSGSGAGSTLLI